jgi:tetratricopeptide (TPR) repeat protein
VTKVSSTLWRLLLLAIAAFLSWQILTHGLAAHYAQRLARGDADALPQLRRWQPDHPRVLYQEGLREVGEDRQAALDRFARAYAANPTDPYPLVAVAALYFDSGRAEEADALMQLADRLKPVDPRIQQRLALHWDQRGDPATALRHLSKAMSANGRIRRENLPVILRLAEDPALRGLLEPVALDAPMWWPGFFGYAANRATSTEVVRYLMALRRQTGADAITAAERAAYQNRLLRDGFAAEAYLAWLNGLEPAAREQLGLVFNGGFELPLGNSGFAWQARPHKQLTIRPLRTLGTAGSKSLLVRFSSFDDRFAHLGQRLFLQPGRYRLTGVARVDRLETEGGVRWRVQCHGEGNALLGESRVFRGPAPWGDFSIDFDVPARNCDTQDLRLVSAGKHNFELAMDGALWFDALRIQRADGDDAEDGADAVRNP